MRSLLVLVIFCSGCIAASVKGRVGVVSDGGSAGVQVGATVSIGVAGKRSAVLETIGLATGNAPKAGLDIGLDYARFPENEYSDLPFGWRVGFATVPVAHGSPASMGRRVAPLWILRDRKSYSGHEKFGSSAARTLHALGLEAMLGQLRYDATDDDEEREVFGGSLSLTYEWFMLGG